MKVTKPDAPDATWKGLPWKVIAIRAVQGHNKTVLENAKLSSIVKQVFTLDPTFGVKDLDGFKLPKANVSVDLVPELTSKSNLSFLRSACVREGLGARTHPWWMA